MLQEDRREDEGREEKRETGPEGGRDIMLIVLGYWNSWPPDLQIAWLICKTRQCFSKNMII